MHFNGREGKSSVFVSDYVQAAYQSKACLRRSRNSQLSLLEQLGVGYILAKEFLGKGEEHDECVGEHIIPGLAP